MLFFSMNTLSQSVALDFAMHNFKFRKKTLSLWHEKSQIKRYEKST